MKSLDARTTTRPAGLGRGLSLTLAILALLPALAGCTDAKSVAHASNLRPGQGSEVAATEDERPGCRKELPVQYRGISCAGHDYDPPDIPFGELYPPR